MPGLKRKIAVVLGAILIAVAFFYLGRLSTERMGLLETFERRERTDDGFQFISPLLECESPEHLQFKDVRDARVAVENLVQQELGQKGIKDISVYFRDLNNGPWFGIKEDAEFIPASLLKVPVAIAFLRAAQNDPSLVKRPVVFVGDRLDVKPTYNDFPPLKLGASYTGEELLKRMLIFSDNDAMRLLYSMLPKGVLSEVYSDLDLKEQDSPDDQISVIDYASFFRMLYNATYLSKPLSEYTLGILAQAEFNEGLRAGVPKSVVISHKFGEREDAERKVNQLHDCGIVYAPKKPYLLCVMTRGDDLEKLGPIIARISRVVYQKFVTDTD